jgi:hypothetical protein
LRTESAALIVENLLNVEQAALSGLGRISSPSLSEIFLGISPSGGQWLPNIPR